MASGFLSVEAHMRHPQSPLLWIQPSELVVGQSTFNSMPITKNDMYQKTHSFEPMIYIYIVYIVHFITKFTYIILCFGHQHTIHAPSNANTKELDTQSLKMLPQNSH